ncbi:hypothetical protein BDV12DRAFT_190675 [Aspergillus spectabilis]
MVMTPPHSLLARLQTELCNPKMLTLEHLSTLGLCEAFNHEEARVSNAVACCLPTIASFLDELVPRVRNGGRLIYVGAGNSGRVAAMDCSELPVTFSADPAQFVAVVAGGRDALLGAREGAEDGELDGAAEIHSLQLSPADTVLGISASGRTPFVIGALKSAVQSNALTAVVTNVSPSEAAGIAKYAITALVGPELVAGSTRLKAGSAAKQILNMLSTCLMVKLGKTYRGLMVDVQVKNKKLWARGRAIVRQFCKETDQDDDAIDSLIEQCGGSVKLASAIAASGLPLATAQKRLSFAGGNLDTFLQKFSDFKETVSPEPQEVFIAIDGGGTNCSVSVAARSGIVIASATTGACNLSSVPLEELLNQIQQATTEATANIPNWRAIKVWAGLAGLHHAYEIQALTQRLEALFRVSLAHGSLLLTSDGMLLNACIGLDSSITGGITAVAGTGSVVAAYRRTGNGDVQQVGRAGGWGHLLGDEGSAFDIGKRALQALLMRCEQDECQFTELDRQILSKLDCTAKDVLFRVLHSEQPAKLQISSLARVVTKLGFQLHPDPQALAILRGAAMGLVKNIHLLATGQFCEPCDSSLVLSGALMNISAYRNLIIGRLQDQNLHFKKIIIVDNPSDRAAQFLARNAGE